MSYLLLEYFQIFLFVQECLKRFGTSGDEFVLVYRGKEDKEMRVGETQTMTNHLLKSYVSQLLKSKTLFYVECSRNRGKHSLQMKWQPTSFQMAELLTSMNWSGDEREPNWICPVSS